MGSVETPRERVLVLYGSLSPEVEESIREMFADQELTIYQPKPGEVTPPSQWTSNTREWSCKGTDIENFQSCIARRLS